MGLGIAFHLIVETVIVETTINALGVVGLPVGVLVLGAEAMALVVCSIKVILKGYIRSVWIFLGIYCKPKVTSSLKDKFRKNS